GRPGRGPGAAGGAGGGRGGGGGGGGGRPAPPPPQHPRGLVALRRRGAGGGCSELSAGEGLDMAALGGKGQDRLFEILSGNVRAAGGEILVDGQPMRFRHPFDAIRRGGVLGPSNRLLALLR